MDLSSVITNLKTIYQDMDAYQNLTPGDQEFFDSLFPLLIVFPDLNMSNKEIAERLKKYCTQKNPDAEKPLSISTVEKRIRHLKRAGLISGYGEKSYDSTNQKWTTDKRHLSLDSELFAFMKIKEQEQRILTARLEAANKDLEPMLAAYKETQKKKEEPAEPPPQNYRIEVRFN